MDDDWITPAPRRAAAGRLSRAAAPDGVVCPICGRTISLARIQVHADRCANQTEPNEAFVTQRRIKAKANAASAPDSCEDVPAFGRPHRDRQPQPLKTSAPAAAGKTTTRSQAPTRMSKRMGAPTRRRLGASPRKSLTLCGSTCSGKAIAGLPGLVNSKPPVTNKHRRRRQPQSASQSSSRCERMSPRAFSGERSRPSMPIQFCSNSTTGAFCRIDRVLMNEPTGGPLLLRAATASVTRGHCLKLRNLINERAVPTAATPPPPTARARVREVGIYRQALRQQHYGVPRHPSFLPTNAGICAV